MDYRIKDMKHKRFGRLTGIEYSHTDRYGAHWLFQCDCGNQTVLNSSSVRLGRTQSCGCLLLERKKEATSTHGKANSRAYKVWVSMKQRCLNPKSTGYPLYGGRGITISDDWLSFAKFYEDMGDPPEGSSIERLDNDRGYFKDNCQWADRSQQNINKGYQNKTTNIRNISYNQRDNSYTVGFSRNKKRYRKDFKNLEDAIQWKAEMLQQLEG